MRYLLIILTALTLSCCTNPRSTIAGNGSEPDWDRQAEVMEQWQAERPACEVEGKQK
jgi:hypothetical protein